MFTLTRLLFLTLFLVVSIAPESFAEDLAAAKKSYGQWMRLLGSSGLRRSMANGSDLGVLINRSTTYRLARQNKNAFIARGESPENFEFDSSIDGAVAQAGSLIAISKSEQRHFATEVTWRTAWRFGEAIDVTSSRLDLAAVWSAAPIAQRAGYISVNAIAELTDVDIFYVNGERKGDGYGLRYQMGEVLSDTWAYSLKLEQVRWEGDGFIYRPTGTGPVYIAQDAAYNRRYGNLDVIARFTPPVFGETSQLRWRSGLHYLSTHYDSQTNSLGQVVIEPFGNKETLALLRTGVYLSWQLGEEKHWSPFIETLYDYEIDTNMNSALDEPHTLAGKLGIAYLPFPGKRLQLEVQRYQGVGGEQVRNSINFTAVWDLF